MSADDGARARGGLASAWRTITLVAMGLLGVAVLVALIVTLGEANRQRDRALRLQAHSYDVMVLARTLSGTIARSEASLGRYVISADKKLGQLYFDDWRLAGEQIERLARITGDSADQQRRVETLRSAYRTRGDELSLTALSTNYGKNNQALSRYYQARRAPALAQINDLLEQIIARERTLLNRRTDAAMASVERSSRIARALSIFGILIVLGAIVLGWLTLRATSERALAQAEADSERDRAEALAAAVAEATETVRQQDARLRQVQKMEAVGQLTGGIAHDFNNMLAVVIGGLELARRGLAQGADIRRHLDAAGEGAERAAALTRQLLAFAREQAINPEPIAVGTLVAGMRDLLDRTLGDGVTIAVADAGGGWQVRADRVQFENTMLNLAVNARDAMAGRGTLTIAVAQAGLAPGERAACDAGDYVTVTVRDTGTGMTPEVLERAFEPFFTTKPVGKGTGLGLSQIFAFARQQRGDVAIASAPGQGTAVTLYLPRDSGEPAIAVAETATAVPAAAGPLRILVVEDDPRVLRATLGALEELEHTAIACDDPLALPAMLDAHAPIDLILSDVLMPGQTGPEMIAALDPRHAGVAVLFVTGFAGDAGGVDFGGRPVLRKPFTLAALERAVAEALGDRAPAAPHGPDAIAAE